MGSFAKKLGWRNDTLHVCSVAWKAYKPEMLDQGSSPVLANVRFLLGGFHTVMLSENLEMIRQMLGNIWKMLTTFILSPTL